ncbi:uncharacterized protein N7469_009451 [Penicillium citrinum]|uniref:Uncharacterized protein n=1 Tax=Penicillium citrinum TaxID=5077 RepID=A0A9W9NNQ5_PENCI|nr:uncharacterized protein N7469_009451 [Penicillium citrinum]KAJ5223211.1 hypothetical protein N7469_009451 [Penicillium citrinum]
MKANRARRVRLGAAPLGWARCAWVITGAGGCAGGGQAMYGLGQGPVLAVAPPRAAPAVGGPGVSQPSLCAGIPAGRPTARAPVAPRGSGDDGRRGGGPGRIRPGSRRGRIRQLAGGSWRAARGEGEEPRTTSGALDRPRRGGRTLNAQGGNAGRGRLGRVIQLASWRGGGPRRYISHPGGCTTYPLYIYPTYIPSPQSMYISGGVPVPRGSLPK